MGKEIFDFIKKESKHLGILFIALFIAIEVAYYKESIAVVLRYSASLFWLFVLPGYSIMLYWRERLEFLERVVAGIGLSAAVVGISSYYIGLAGLNILYHGILLPLVIILAGVGINLRK